MTTWFATANGNINSAGRWNSAPDGSGSTLTWPPASGDVLVANGKTIVVNVYTNLGPTGEVRNDAANGATAGGGFTMSNYITLTANVYAGTSNCVTCNQASGAIVGNCYASSTGNFNGVFYSGTGTFTITGNCYGGAVSSSYGAFISSAGTLNITGDCISGASFASVGAGTTGVGTLNITGNCLGTLPGRGAYCFSTGTVNVTGNVIAGEGVGAEVRVSGTLNISGYTQASSTKAGVLNLAEGIVEVGETRSAPNGRGAIDGAFRYASATAAVAKPIINGAQETLSVLDVAALVPAVDKVRQGVIYGDGAYTGTKQGVQRHIDMRGRF